MIAIVIVNWNGKEDTLACIKSLKALNYPSFEIIVVDNGSTDGSVEVIRDVHLIDAKQNLGFAGGNNLGIEYALKRGADAILLLNNDTIVAPDLLSSFAEAAKIYPNTLLGAKIFQFDSSSRLDHLGGNWNKQKACFDLIGKNAEDGEAFSSFLLMDYICGCALFIPKTIFNTIGLLDPDYFLYWEDSDFCFRAKKAGFACRLCPSAKVWHKGGGSTQNQKSLPTYFWWRNRLRFMKKHLDKRTRKSLLRQEVYPQIRHIAKLYLLKSLTRPLSKNKQKRLTELSHYKAALKGFLR